MSKMARALNEQSKQDRRADIVAAALDEFFERGFAAARMEDVARRAGVSKGALYLYFDSKDALFRALIEAVALPNVARLEQSIAEAPNASAALDAILAFAPYVIRETAVPKIMKILVADASNFPDAATAYRRAVIDRVLAAMTGLIAHATATGEMDADDPETAARLIMAPMAFSGLWRIVFEHDEAARLNLEALFAAHGRYVRRALFINQSGAAA